VSTAGANTITAHAAKPHETDPAAWFAPPPVTQPLPLPEGVAAAFGEAGEPAEEFWPSSHPLLRRPRGPTDRPTPVTEAAEKEEQEMKKLAGREGVKEIAPALPYTRAWYELIPEEMLEDWTGGRYRQ
jgi:hypothetical protein